MRVYLWLWLMLWAISSPLHAIRQATDREDSCGVQVHGERFLTPEGKALRDLWRQMQTLAAAHGIEDSAYKPQINTDRFLLTDNLEVFALAGAYSRAFHQFDVFGGIAHRENLDFIKDTIASRALINEDKGIQIQIALTPGTFSAMSIQERENFVLWGQNLVKRYSRCVLIFYSADPVN